MTESWCDLQFCCTFTLIAQFLWILILKLNQILHSNDSTSCTTLNTQTELVGVKSFWNYILNERHIICPWEDSVNLRKQTRTRDKRDKYHHRGNVHQFWPVKGRRGAGCCAESLTSWTRFWVLCCLFWKWQTVKDGVDHVPFKRACI